MQHLPAPIHHARDAAQLPVAIDYPAALALRQMSMVHDELPKYLLAPEVSALLHYVPDQWSPGYLQPDKIQAAELQVVPEN